jgi:hypothetical protein
LADLAINRACDVEAPGHVQKRVCYGRQGVAIGRDQADQVRRIGFGQRNPDQSVIWQQQKGVRHDARPVTEAQMGPEGQERVCLDSGMNFGAAFAKVHVENSAVLHVGCQNA